MNSQSRKKIIEQAKAARRSRKKKFAGPSSADSPENAEQAQRQGEDRFRSILSSIDDLVFVLDSDGVFIDYFQSPSASELYVPPKDFLGKSYKEIMPANVVELMDIAMKELAAAGQSQQFEYSLQIGDKEFWFSARISMRRDVNGEITDYILVARDITERGRAEQALQRARDELEMRIEQRTVELGRANEALRVEVVDRKHAEDALQAQVRRNELILRTSHDGFWICGPNGGLRDVNDAYCRMVGYSRQELLAMNIADVEANENPQEVEAHINNIIETGYGCFETRHHRKDGSFIHLDVSSSPAEMDGERFFFTFFRDITERKQAEEALQAQMQRNELILRTTRDGFCVCGPVGDFRDVNDAYCRMVGYSREELLTMNATDVEANEKPEDTRSRIESIIEEGYGHFETRHRRKDGSIVYLDISSTPAELDGQWFFFAFVRDITDRKRAEEDIARLAKFPSENPNPVLRVAADGVVHYGNEASLPILDLWQCRQSDHLSGIWYELLCEVLGEGKPHETEVRCDDKIYLLRFAPVEDAGFVNVYGLDITERKRAEDSLRESEKKYRIVTETSVDAIYQLDSAGNLTFINSAGAKMYGCEPEEIIGMNFSSLMTEQRLSQGSQIVQEVLSGQPVQGELYVKHKTGHEFPIYFSMAPVVEEGNVVGFAGVSRNITERKQAEQQLLEYQAKLKSLASQLSVTEERERHRLATELHDRVGQSLVFSKMKLESLRESVSSSELAESLDEACEFLGQTIQEARTVIFDLSSPVLYELGFEAAAAEWLTDEIRNKHRIETVFENDGRNKPLTDDIRAVLFRSVRELLFNVVKHAQAKNVKVSVCRDDGNICVTIEDDGVGFDPGEVATNEVGRAEFGLFSIRERLGPLGGHLEIESEPGRGTKIMMTAPLKHENISDGVEV